MPFSLNRVELIGRLGQDPGMRYTPEGQAVSTFSLATDRPAKRGTRSEPDWHSVVCWQKLVEFSGQHLSKGRLVVVAGCARSNARWYKPMNWQSDEQLETLIGELERLARRPTGKRKRDTDTIDQVLRDIVELCYADARALREPNRMGALEL